MAGKVPFATMVAVASMISAPEFLLAHTLSPDPPFDWPDDAPPLAQEPATARTASGLDADLRPIDCGTTAEPAWQMSDMATKLMADRPVTAQASETCLQQMLSK